ncbi:MAG: L-seryl-tRNA(Sec) selenium transferase [Deltaproteobacteria bacterium]|nr:MAG: L-seryl-tRNA(Sec) selenium transferase [Deltaproteobacteria bacterium]
MFNLTPPRREQARLSSGRAVRHHAGVATSTTNPRRAIPSVERLLRAAAGAALAARYRREHVVETTRMVLDDLRRAATDGARVPADAEILERVRLRLEGGSTPRLMRVINATGVVLHTNLGRAPLAEEAIAALTAAARGAVNLELDLESGRRGDRDALLAEDLRALTGAEASLVVNNNAAAVLLLLDTLARDREVVVSRGELIEIGGAFRMPDIMAGSGARLHEVGTTNRTHAEDYRRAIGPDTALLLKVHTSNFRIVGFTASVELAELVAMGRAAGVPVAEDLGSGALVDLAAWGLPREPVVSERIAAGADVVTFSGDKLLGGPQAGVIVGRRNLVARLASNPLRRALRPDKLTMAALGATLRLYRESPDLGAALPTLRLLTRSVAEMEAVGRAAAPLVATRLGAGYRVEVVAADGEVGSGAVPDVPLPSRALAIDHPEVPAERIAARFRAARPPVIGRVREGRFLLDLRAVFDPHELAVELG